MRRIETICIIDDDGLYTMLLKKKIEKLNLCDKIMTFPDGENAIENFKQYLNSHELLPDVILLDINMPVMNGWEFMEEFIKILPLVKKKIFVYIASSSIALEDKQKAQTYDAIENFLSKPIETETLVTISTLN